MKVVIEKEIEAKGDTYFMIYANEKFVTCLLFKPDNEAEKFAEALSIAKQIEDGRINEKGKIIIPVYQSKEDISEPLQTLSNLQQ